MSRNVTLHLRLRNVEARGLAGETSHIYSLSLSVCSPSLPRSYKLATMSILYSGLIPVVSTRDLAGPLVA